VNFKILAAADVESLEAAAWYDDQRLGLGDDFLTELDRVYERVRTAPGSCSLLESYPGPHEIRRCLLGRFPYLVIFLCRPDEVVVLVVSHAVAAHLVGSNDSPDRTVRCSGPDGSSGAGARRQFELSRL
jgi:toxin ParE1/3/4